MQFKFLNLNIQGVPTTYYKEEEKGILSPAIKQRWLNDNKVDRRNLKHHDKNWQPLAEVNVFLSGDRDSANVVHDALQLGGDDDLRKTAKDAESLR